MFVTVALGSGIESVIEQNATFSIFAVLLSPEIYFPIIGFFPKSFFTICFNFFSLKSVGTK